MGAKVLAGKRRRRCYRQQKQLNKHRFNMSGSLRGGGTKYRNAPLSLWSQISPAPLPTTVSEVSEDSFSEFERRAQKRQNACNVL